jgi:high affinity Mn2+ porin
MKRFFFTFWPLLPTVLFLVSTPLLAQRDNNNNYLDSLRSWSFHVQSTVIVQGHAAFRGAGYEGPNTLSPRADTALSITTTLFVGRKLWRGASLFFNPEIAGGRGVGHRDPQALYDETLYTPAVGIAGFPNGETFRIGSPKPALYVARLYLEQIIPLGDGYAEIQSEANQLKQRLPQSRVVITAGKFSIADMFDNNRYSHDPRTDFLNWSLMSHGSWDYPANTRGYTYGLVVEYIRPTHALRLGPA